MSYFKASDVLPKKIIEEVQKYVDGELIYIPRKENSRRKWGCKTGIKEKLSLRNLSIYQDYMKGISYDALSEKYYLTSKSIERIIREEKKKNSNMQESAIGIVMALSFL